MKFSALAGMQSSIQYVAPAEKVFDNYKKWLEDTNPIFTVQAIEVFENNFSIQTAYFTVRCSFKFRSVAGPIEKYLDSLAENHTQVGIPLLMLSGFNDKGYVKYTFGYDAEEEYTAYPYFRYFEGELQHAVFLSEMAQTDDWKAENIPFVLRDEEKALFEAKKPDPKTPAKPRARKLRSTKPE